MHDNVASLRYMWQGACRRRTLAIKEAVGVQRGGEEAQHGAAQGQKLDVAPDLPARGHRAGARHQERRHRLRLLAQDVEDLHTRTSMLSSAWQRLPAESMP